MRPLKERSARIANVRRSGPEDEDGRMAAVLCSTRSKGCGDCAGGQTYDEAVLFKAKAHQYTELQKNQLAVLLG